MLRPLKQEEAYAGNKESMLIPNPNLHKENKSSNKNLTPPPSNDQYNFLEYQGDEIQEGKSQIEKTY